MNIRELAEQAGDNWNHTLESDKEFLKKFAALVAAHEREECANIAHQWSKREDDVGGYIEAAIRARSKA